MHAHTHTHVNTHTTDSQRYGRGKLELSTGEVYEGDFRDDMITGEGEMKYSKTSKYHGSWLHGMVRYAVLCSVMQCYTVLCSVMQYCAVLCSITQYYAMLCSSSTQRNGMGAMVYDDNSSFNGDWRLDLRHGHGELVTKDGAVYRGLWVSDKPHGKGTLHIPTAHYTYNGENFS